VATLPGTPGDLSAFDAQIRFAIAHRRLLQLTYNDRTRVLEPHDYGVLNGAAKLLAFQLRESGVAGANTSGWRLFDLSRVTACLVLSDEFQGSRQAGYEHHHQWEVVHARVG
jgi:hypothetical protein